MVFIETVFDQVIDKAFHIPLSRSGLLKFNEDASCIQPAKVLCDMNSYDFVRTVRTMFEYTKLAQRLVLQDIIRSNAKTEYGKKYHFDEIKSVTDFREKVPVTAWEDYKDYVGRMEKGEEDVLFAGKATFFYRTSGTVEAYKLIPESKKEMIARKAVTKARYYERIHASSLKALKRVFSIYNKGELFLTEGNIPAGTASGRTMQIADESEKEGKKGVKVNMPGVMAYSPLVLKELEGEALYYTVMRLTVVYDDIGAVMGNNARMMSMLAATAQKHAKEIIEDIKNGTSKYELSDELKEAEKEALTPNPKRAKQLEKLLKKDRFIPRYYWPNLAMASFWLGGSVGVFVKEARKLFPEKTAFVDTGYGASEAKVNIPVKTGQPASPLSVLTAFYEFIPEEGGRPLLAEELEDGKTYELLLTTYGGLYRYRIKDYVRVEGFTGTTPNIYFVSKAQDMANLVMEKLAGSVLLEAIAEIVTENNMPFTFAQVYPNEKTAGYVICIEAKGQGRELKAFSKIMDEGLAKKVSRYNLYRNELKLLNPCEVHFMKAGWYDMLMNGNAGGNATATQVKIPVVAKEMPASEWIREESFNFLQ